jgi:hypothetical protein
MKEGTRIVDKCSVEVLRILEGCKSLTQSSGESRGCAAGALESCIEVSSLIQLIANNSLRTTLHSPSSPSPSPSPSLNSVYRFTKTFKEQIMLRRLGRSSHTRYFPKESPKERTKGAIFATPPHDNMETHQLRSSGLSSIISVCMKDELLDMWLECLALVFAVQSKRSVPNAASS